MRVVIADDSILFRHLLAEVLSALPDVEVVGHASNGRLAVRKVCELEPDLLTLDMEMPEMDGLSVLDALRSSCKMPAVIVVSALTRQGGRLTIQALQKGAFDFITKPDDASAEKNRSALSAALAPKIKALSLRLGVRSILRGRPEVDPAKAVAESNARQPASDLTSVGERMCRLSGIGKPELVLIGVSTGGPTALEVLLSKLPPSLGVPVLIVQHMPPVFTQSLAENLDSKSRLKVREAVDGEPAMAGCVYIAPGGRQMRLVPGPNGSRVIQITDDPPENNCRPSVDYLFRSVALNFPGRAMGVILTGMGNDGVLGLRMLKRDGSFVIAQDEASCVVYGMPKAAVDAGVVDLVAPIEAVAGRIVDVVQGACL